MKKLFSPFDWDACEARIRPVVISILCNCLIAGVRLPNTGKLANRYTQNIAGYICEMVRNRGNESKEAYKLACTINGEFEVLEDAEMIRDDWYEKFLRPAMQFILEDELRRCGVGNVEGVYIDDDEEAQPNGMYNAAYMRAFMENMSKNK